MKNGMGTSPGIAGYFQYLIYRLSYDKSRRHASAPSQTIKGKVTSDATRHAIVIGKLSGSRNHFKVVPSLLESVPWRGPGT